MYWLRIGNVAVNLGQVTDVDLNAEAGMVAINFASLALIDNELEGRTLYFGGRDAKEIRGYFASLTGKHLTTLTEYEAAPPEVTECSPCPPSEAASGNKDVQLVFRISGDKDIPLALNAPDGTLKTVIESLQGRDR